MKNEKCKNCGHSNMKHFCEKGKCLMNDDGSHSLICDCPCKRFEEMTEKCKNCEHDHLDFDTKLYMRTGKERWDRLLYFCNTKNCKCGNYRRELE